MSVSGNAPHPLPEKAGPYLLLTELGRGGMGRVLLGVAPDGRTAAVKLVHARHAADDGFRSRFRREVEASRKVSGAYTAAVLDADADAELPWLASVFVAGPSLGAAVERAGALPAEALHRLAVGLATALDEIHRAGLVHRDLKPENVLLAEDGARVIDFGIARAAEAGDVTELTGTGWVVGSPPFMSPEQAEGRELTGASDVFSLGSVLVLAATGRSPFAGTSALQTLYNLVHTEPDLSGIPPALCGIVVRCLAKNPAGRPTPAELLALLGPVTRAARPWPPAVHRMVDEQRARVEGLLDGDPERTALLSRDGADSTAVPRTAVPTTYGTPAPPPRRRPRHRPVAWVAAGAVLAAGLGVGGYLLQRDDGDGGPPDKYVTMPVCSEAVPKLPLREERRKDKDSYRERAEEASTQCSWFDKDQPQPDGWNYSPSASVSWDLYRSDRGENGTGKARDRFAGGAKGERRADGLGLGDAAYWSAPERDQQTCRLSVRDGNLVVDVFLDATKHPACEAEAQDIMKAALAAMPPRAN
ncbi:serine/threonine protein kinase [Streptomyces rectiverticillatus]|uniref:serine/threonine-protein kinase n=1 Tax=Streptomyces rectiverticillatus TaxID=173860 RepID=UPI0015C3603F|nr:serine/threonine-protein kinase [Streptomyces rectiverticillatus]QLE70372.1 serine/threonine protein kinase [Streptomyces rectiverticillatus]